MLKDVSYNPDRMLVHYNREEVLKIIEDTCDPDTYEVYRDGKVSDIFTKLADGVYEFYDVNSPDDVIDPEYDLDCYPQDNEGHYEFLPCGVCDDYKQILERDANMMPIITNDEHFILVLCCIRKDEQPASCGWRWHKWGRYIGDFHPQHEYLYNETGIDQVYVYQVYKVIKRETKTN